MLRIYWDIQKQESKESLKAYGLSQPREEDRIWEDTGDRKEGEGMKEG